MPLTRDPTPYTIFINGAAQANARLLQVTKTAGGGSVPSQCVFEINEIDHFDTGFNNAELQSLFNNSTVEVQITLGEGAGLKVIHFGRITHAAYASNETMDQILLTSRMDPHLFGREVRLVQQAHRDINNGPNVAIGVWNAIPTDGDTVFNPIVDGRTIPNALQHNVGAGGKWSIVDPDSVFIPTLDSYITTNQDIAAPPASANGFGYWNLSEVVYYLCWALNQNEDYVTNPTRGELQAVLAPDQRIVRNLRIPLGERLPSVLDKVLTPYGYQWKVEFTALGSRKIIAYQRGSGPPLFLRLDDFEQDIQPLVSNVPSQRVAMDLSRDAFNEVEVLGDFPMVEHSFELMPAWLPIYDDPTSVKDFRSGGNNWLGNSDLRRAWRDFVLNENGDYMTLRDEPRYLERFDLSTLFAGNGDFLANSKRKRFFPTVTLGTDGTPIGETHGVHVEYWDPTSDQWLEVRGGADGKGGLDGGQNIQVLTNECGIRFASPETPPIQLIAIGSNFGIENVKIRVTASIKADQRLAGYEFTNLSLLADPRRKTIDSSQQFKYRRVGDGSIYFPFVINQTLKSTQVDGRAGAQKMALELLAKWQKSSVNGTIEVDGLDWAGIDLGDTIQGAAPRNLGFRATHPNLPAQYPTITSITYNVEQQRTLLSIDTYRATR